MYTRVHAPAVFARVCDSVAVAMALRTPTSKPLRIHTACVPPVFYVHRSVESEKDGRSRGGENETDERETKRDRDRYIEREGGRVKLLTRKRKKKRELEGVEWQEGNGEPEREDGECRERV